MSSGEHAPERDGHALIDRAKDVFFELIEADAGIRERRLDELCGADDALRHAVLGLLEAHEGAGEFLREPPRAAASGPAALPLPTGSRIGPYLLERVLGEGGFGVVYLAQQQEPIRRAVALKVLKLGMDTARIAARFEVERQTLALMDHPGIAKVLDAGTTPRGRPFFVMEYVDGAPITEFCDRERLGVRDRLGLFERVCLAVEHAHQKGVIHRDLKPSNVLVKLVDGEPVPKVIDFGIAKAAGGRLAEHTLTGERQVVGTPEYMAPEQTVPAKQGEQDVDTRADVYSLGVILYRLLAGQSPYTVDAFGVASPGTWRDAICEGELPRPSSRVRQSGDDGTHIAAHRGTTPERLTRMLRAELDWIALRAIEKDRARRYQSASALGADIRRYLLDQPVDAGPPSARYRLAKFCRRHRAAVAAAVTVFVLAVVAAAVSTHAAVVADRERQEADRLRAAAERQAYVANVFAAEAALQERDSVGARRRLEATPPALRGWEWRYFEARIEASESVVQRAGTAPSMMRLSRDGRRLAVGWRDGAVGVYDTVDRELRAEANGFGQGVAALAWANDGDDLYIAPDSGGLFRWRWRDDEVVPIHGHEATVSDAVVVPGDGELVTASHDGTLRLWDPETLVPRLVLDHGARVARVYVSPDGETLVSVGWDQALAVWDRSTGSRRGVTHAARPSTPIVPERRWPPGEIMAVAFAPSSHEFVTACRDGLAVVWDAAAVTRRGAIDTHDDVVRDVAWSPDGTRIALACRDGAATLWDARSLALIALLSHDADVRSVAFSADSGLLATTAWDRTVRLFDAVRGTGVDVLLGHGEGVYDAAFVPGSLRLVSLSEDGSVRFWTPSAAGVALCRAHSSGVYALATGPGARVVTGGIGGPVFVWDTDRGVAVAGPLVHGPGIQAVAVSPDGAVVATASTDDGLRLWNVATGSALRDLVGHTGRTVSLAFDATGRRLASGSRDGTARIWDAPSGDTVRVLAGHVGEVVEVAFLPGGDRLASCGQDGTVRVWDVATGVPRLTRDLGSGWVSSLAVAPDGSRIAVGTGSRVILTLDARTLDTLATLVGHSEFVSGLAWLPDGSRIVSGAVDRLVKLWDPATGEELATLRGHVREVQGVAVSTDGLRIFSGSEDCTVRMWEVPR
ncbi:MAG: protein kinase [Planctomycetes bacterium]|nr:protein kinase [Planctomycetota bacterium]